MLSDDFYGNDSLVPHPKENNIVLELEHEKTAAWMKRDILLSQSVVPSLVRDAYFVAINSSTHVNNDEVLSVADSYSTQDCQDKSDAEEAKLEELDEDGQKNKSYNALLCDEKKKMLKAMCSFFYVTQK